MDDCVRQAANALAVVDAMAEPGSPYLLLGGITHADVAAFVAERLARGIGIDTETRMPRLHNLATRLAETPLLLLPNHRLSAVQNL
jgi:glutathione S-transferase